MAEHIKGKRYRSKATDMHTLWMEKLRRELNWAIRNDNGDYEEFCQKLLRWGARQSNRTAAKKGGLGRR